MNPDQAVPGIADANSSEFEPQCKSCVIDILPEQKKIEGLGGNMRLGGKDIALPVAGVFEVRDGKIAAWRDYFDLATWQRQAREMAHPGAAPDSPGK